MHILIVADSVFTSKSSFFIHVVNHLVFCFISSISPCSFLDLSSFLLILSA